LGECTNEFLSKWLGSFSKDILDSAERSGVAVKLVVKEKVISLVIREGRYLEEIQEGHMQTVRNAVRTREELGPSDAEISKRY
jgi:hypothetical protein